MARQARSTPLTPIARLQTRRAFARWRAADGTTLETPLTAEAYTALGLPGAGEPDRTGVPASAVWLFAAGGVICYDTPDQRLPFGGYELTRSGSIRLGVGQAEPVIFRGSVEELTTTTQVFTREGTSFRLANGTLEEL